ncbi:MAG: hypothetical protein FIA95_06730 [Gemmatimonadetes bacterium]|nr:hypothetical protein [Gemmatimonadota bacterium]
MQARVAAAIRGRMEWAEGPMSRLVRWALLVAARAVLPQVSAAQSWRTVSMSRQASGQQDLRVQVEYGAGTFTVRPAEQGLLYRMRLRYDEEAFEPTAELRGSRLRLGVKGTGSSVRVGKKGNSGEMDLTLGRGIPMDLDLEFGAVRADLDLGGLSLTDLELSTGASESTVDVSEPNPEMLKSATFQVGAADFTARRLGNLNARSISVDAGVGSASLWFDGSWQQDADVALNMGLGSLELHFPEGLGVKLTKDSFLTSLDSEGMVKRGDAYYSLDWERAQRKVTIQLDAAFGSVKVLWVR